MKSYFFVPANRLHKIHDVVNLGVDTIIIDLEDSVKTSEISNYIDKLISDETYKDFYVRLNILNANLELNATNFNRLAENGFRRFVLPKLQNATQLRNFFLSINKNDFQFIILVESPKFFIQLDAILEEFSSNIYGVGLGSHDLLSTVGAKHTMNNLEFIRQSVLYSVSAYEKEAIDFASMNISDEKAFTKELIDGFEKGYDSKFIIHPWQLECLNNVSFYNEQDLKWATAIYDELVKLNFETDEFNALSIGDQIVEKPHINKAMKIIEYFKKQP